MSAFQFQLLLLLLQLLLCAGYDSATLTPTKLTFSAPEVVCTGPQPYAVGFRSLTPAVSVGPCAGHLYATADAGHSFRPLPTGVQLPHGTVSVFPTAPGAVRNFGSMGAVPDKLGRYTAFAANDTYELRVSGTGAVSASAAPGNMTFSGLPRPATCGDLKRPGEYGCPFRLSGTGVVRLADATLVQSVILYWGGDNNPKVSAYATSVVAFRSTDNGATWLFGGVIANASAVVTQEGPNENDLTLLADGRILCVVRIDAGDGFSTHPYSPYHASTSSDGGVTWTPLVSLGPGVGCARPRLGTFGNSVVLAGRLSPTNRDIFLWLNAAGDGASWDPHYSVTYMHNALEPNTSLHFTPAVNASTSRETTSYTSLVATSDSTGFLVYSRVLPPQPDVVFAMRFQLQ